MIDCGLIAQVMHLHYLRDLSDRFAIAVLCDISAEMREACAADYGVTQIFSDWRDLLGAGLDAVLILTSGSHAPIAIAAAEVGLHVLVEKPMCFSVAEGRQMIDAASPTGTTLMVAYNKRYDPAYLRLAAQVPAIRDLRLLRVTTLESPGQPYVAHYPLRRGGAPDTATVARLEADNAARVAAALGDADALSRRAYHQILLDSMVHEFNAVRGLLGEPDAIEFADIRDTGLTVILRFGTTQCIVAWVDLPGIALYSMEFMLYSPELRLTLSLPSPHLRSAPTLLVTEGGEADSARSWHTEQVTSYAESFREELIHFHECVSMGRVPVTSGEDALRDVALCEAIVAAYRGRVAVDLPR